MSKDRAVGSLVGLAVGDALGTTIEFRERDTYTAVVDIVGGGPFKLQPGEWTDDTSMALCLADSLLADQFDAAHLLSLFHAWYSSGLYSVKGRCFDIGATTRSGIASWARKGTTEHNFEEWDSGNGGIMRLAPAAIAFHDNADWAARIAAAQSSTTHASTLCIDSAEFLARYLVNLYNGEDQRPQDSVWRKEVQRIAVTDYTAVSRDDIASSGFVVDTLEAAVWAVANTDNFKDAVLLAVNLGEDADTVGAVAGQIAGAKWGLSSIPSEWVERLAMRDIILDRAERLYNKEK